MKCKKGILIKNFLSIIIAVIGLALLFYGIYRIYLSVVSSDDERAKELIDNIIGKLENMDKGDLGKFSIRGVKGWFLSGWSKGKEGRPDKCFFDSCLCICPIDDKKPAGVSCQNKGFCRKINLDKVAVFDFIRQINVEKVIVNENDVVRDIYNPKYYERKKWMSGEGNLYPLLDNSCPDFSTNGLFELFSYKTEDSVSLLLVRDLEQETFSAKACI